MSAASWHLTHRSVFWAYTLADILYGEMLCWDMSGGAYCYAKRTEEFCNLFLGSIMAPYLIRKDVTQ